MADYIFTIQTIKGSHDFGIDVPDNETLGEIFEQTRRLAASERGISIPLEPYILSYNGRTLSADLPPSMQDVPDGAELSAHSHAIVASPVRLIATQDYDTTIRRNADITDLQRFAELNPNHVSLTKVSTSTVEGRFAKLPGIARIENNEPVFSEEHEFRITMNSKYPHEEPLVYLMTELFHPNVSPSNNNKACAWIYWAPNASTLVYSVLQLACLIQYQSVNIEEPHGFMNRAATAWFKEYEPKNTSAFPLGEVAWKLPVGRIDKLATVKGAGIRTLSAKGGRRG